MPSFAKTIGMIFAVAVPTGLSAQTFPPGNPPFNLPENGAVSYTPTAASPAGPGRIRERPAPALHGVAPLPYHGPADHQPQGAWGPEASREFPRHVQPAAYESPLAPENTPIENRAMENPSAETGRPGQLRDDATRAIPLYPSGRKPSPRLHPPGDARRTSENHAGGLSSTITVVSSLAVVLGIFLVVAWGMRRAAPTGSALLPGEVFEVLGRAPMASRQQVYLLRCGTRLVLVSVTAAGAETLTEITDPPEVDRLAGLCHQARPNSATAMFRQILQQFSHQRSAPELALENGDDEYRPAGAGSSSVRDGLENHHA